MSYNNDYRNSMWNNGQFNASLYCCFFSRTYGSALYNRWNVPTYMLYGEKDNLTSFETISKFANQMNASLTVMRNGEHWFHTDEQMEFLDNWIRQSIL